MDLGERALHGISHALVREEAEGPADAQTRAEIVSAGQGASKSTTERTGPTSRTRFVPAGVSVVVRSVREEAAASVRGGVVVLPPAEETGMHDALACPPGLLAPGGDFG